MFINFDGTGEMKLRLHLLLIFCFAMLALALPNRVQASDIMGADMTYRCLGNDSFEFTTIVYKDCNANWTIPSNTYNLAVSAINCSYTQQTFYPQLVSCVDITPVCAGYCTKCTSTCNSNSTNSNCSFPYGIEKLTFKVIVYLGGTSCCKFHVGYIGNSTRNQATTTCCNSDLFYTYVELDRCQTPCNSSPIFTNDPVGIICAGQDFVFNNGALDSLDGDSLSFELAPAMRSKTNQATYFGSFSYTKPLTFLGFPNSNTGLPGGFHVDPVTGDLAFRPTQANQIAVIVIKVTEWRRVGGALVKVGETRRDMQFIVISCPNNDVPKIDPPYTVMACAGQKICVDIVTSDTNSNDTVKISWNKGIRGATFTNNNGSVKHASGKVCWTPTKNDISNIPHTFTVTAKDNACPVTGQSINSFSIFVRETPEATISTKVLDCGKVALHYEPDKTYPGFVANWIIRDENNRAVYSSANNVPYDTAFVQPGKYTATLFFRTGTPCFNLVSDTFEVQDFVRVRIPSDTFVCAGKSIWIDGTTWSGSSPYTHQWMQLTDSTPYGPFSANEDILVVPDTSTRYVVQVQDASGCKNWDTILVRYSPLPQLDLGPDIRVCKGESSLLDAGNDSTNLTYYWVTGDTTRQLSVDKQFDYWVRVEDSLGCQNYDTIKHILASMNLSAGPDKRACEKDTILLVATGADSYKWYYKTGFSTNPLPSSISNADSFYQVITQNTGYIVRGQKAFDTLVCSYLDTIDISMDPSPFVQLNGLGPYCPDNQPVSLITAVQFPTAFNGVWSCPQTPQAVQNGLFNPTIAGAGNHVLKYEVTDALGCKNSKTITVLVRPAPAISLLDTVAVCANEKELLLNALKQIPANYNGLYVDWFEANANATITANIDKTDPKNAKLRLGTLIPSGNYKMVLRIENMVTGCASYDTCTLVVKPIPAADAGNLTPICFNGGPINLQTASGANPAGGVWTSLAQIQAPVTFNPASLDPANKFVGESIWFYYTRSLGTCSTSDSVLLQVKPIPELSFLTDSFCISDGILDLTQLVTPIGPSSVWTGNGISGNQMDMQALGKGWQNIRYDYTAPNQCANFIQGQTYIQAAPQLKATIPDDICEEEIIAISATYSETPSVYWTRSGDGLFNGSNISMNGPQVTYEAGTADLVNGSVWIQVQSQQYSVCPEVIVRKQVSVFPLPKPAIEASPMEGCEPLEVNFEAKGTIPLGSQYVWNYGEGANVSGIDLSSGLSHEYLGFGDYRVTLNVQTSATQGSCEAEAAPVIIKVFPKPKAAIGADKWVTSVNFPGIQFYDRSVVGGSSIINQWQWSFGDPNNGSSNAVNPYYEYPIVTDTDSVFYWVHLRVETEEGCWDSIGRNLLIVPELSVFIPNAFTPNGEDSKQNETFVIVAGNYKSIRIRVYDRWGEEVFSSNDVKNAWDGTYKEVPAQQDVYVYLVEVVSIHDKVYRYSGTVTLLR